MQLIGVREQTDRPHHASSASHRTDHHHRLHLQFMIDWIRPCLRDGDVDFVSSLSFPTSLSPSLDRLQNILHLLWVVTVKLCKEGDLAVNSNTLKKWDPPQDWYSHLPFEVAPAFRLRPSNLGRPYRLGHPSHPSYLQSQSLIRRLRILIASGIGPFVPRPFNQLADLGTSLKSPPN